MSYGTLVKAATVSALVVALAGSLIGFACSDKSASTGDITITSSVNSGHTHQVTINGADINNPPAADKTIETTRSGGHTHSITLTTQDYESIQGGAEVTAESTSNSGHTHTFVIAK